MEVTITGTTFVPANRLDVWKALHDVDVVAACIPGCRDLKSTSEDAYTLVVAVRFGPLSLGFNGLIEVASSDPPNSYKLVGYGSLSRAARPWGSTTIRLTERGSGCEVHYKIEADLRGPLGLLVKPWFASRFGRSMSAQFVQQFGKQIRRLVHKAPIGREPMAGVA